MLHYIDKYDYVKKSVNTKDYTKTVTVYKVENGYVIYVEKHEKSEDGEYKEADCKVYISKTNPFEQEEKEEKPDIIESLKNINLDYV